MEYRIFPDERKLRELVVGTTGKEMLQEVPQTEGNDKRRKPATSLVVQWLRLYTSTAGGMGSIPDRGTKIPHAVQHNQKIKEFKQIF